MDISKNNLNKNAPIAFFDSGVGGLTVLNKVKQILPNESIVYYGDTIHMPYGEKSKTQLLEYSKDILKFFQSQNCKAVVMACNTTSSMIYEEIKNEYNFKLFPIVQSVAQILAKLPIERLGVFATRATIESKAYEKEIAKYNKDMKIFGQFCQNWVHIAEENSQNDEKSIQIIKSDLDKMLLNNPEKIVLGCTHYPFLLDVLTKFAPKDLFIDPSESFAKKIKTELEKDDLLTNLSNPTEEFFVSSSPQAFQTASKLFYEIKSTPKVLTF